VVVKIIEIEGVVGPNRLKELELTLAQTSQLAGH
jgi:hypothetical protein